MDTKTERNKRVENKAGESKGVANRRPCGSLLPAMPTVSGFVGYIWKCH